MAWGNVVVLSGEKVPSKTVIRIWKFGVAIVEENTLLLKITNTHILTGGLLFSFSLWQIAIPRDPVNFPLSREFLSRTSLAKLSAPLLYVIFSPVQPCFA